MLKRQQLYERSYIVEGGGGWRETILFFTGEILVDADIDDSDGSFECDQPAPH